MPDRTRRTGDLVSENNIFVDIANDRVGIGTTVPEYDLDIGGLENSIDPQNAGFGTVRIASHLGIGHSDLTATSAKPENTSHGGVLTLGPTSDTAKTAYIIFATNTGASNDFGSIAIGDYKNLKSGGATNNIAIGGKNLYNVQSSSNIAIGSQNLQNLTTTSSSNIGIGYQTLNSVTTSSSYNIALGHRAGASGSSNTLDDNIFIGRSAGYLSLSSFSKENIYIGKNAGQDDTTTQRRRNIVIGNVPAAKVGDDQFAIGVDGGSGDYYWLVGDENKNIGIGTTNPTAAVGVGNTTVLAVGIVSAYQLYVDGSPVSGGGISNVVEDTTPQLGGDLNTNSNVIEFPDSSGEMVNRAHFGDGRDLQIYHDGSNSFIQDTGTGNLVIGADNNVEIKNTAGNEVKAKFITDGAVELYYDNSLKFETTGIGVSILNGTEDTATIAGPSNLIIDPGTVGDNTGIVRIKGDLFVDGTQTQINSTTIELADFIVGIATTATSDLLADGAGIQIGPDNTFLYDHTNTSLKSSENLNLASGKTYKIDGTDVLSANTLGSNVSNSSLTSVGTLGSLTVSGDISIADKIIHTDDTDTAIRFPAADTFTVETAGTERFRIDSNGQINFQDSNTYGYITKTGSDLDIHSNNDILLSTDGSEKLRVDISGNVGIGSTIPTQKLDVVGNIAVTGTVDGRNLVTDGNKLDNIEENADVTDATNVDAAGAVMVADTSTDGMGFVIDEDNMTSNSATKVPTQQSVKAYVDANSGGGGSSYWVQTDVGIHTLSSVGIGTTNPQSKLEINVGTAVSAFDIQGSAGQLFSVTNNLTSGSIFSVNDVTGIPSIDVDADGTIQLAPFGSTEYVGIGTTNPTQKLDVNGNVAIGGSIYDANGTAGSDGQVLSNVTGFGVSWADQSGGSQNVFSTIAVSGQNNVVADTTTDTLTLVAGSNMTITTDSETDTITFASSGGGGSSYWVQTDVGIHTLSSVGIGTTNPEATLQVDVGTGTTAFDVLGSEGTLFSVTNNLTSGSIFSVNDVSGMPSIDVDADGTIQLAPSSTTENVGVGTTNPTSKLHVAGDIQVGDGNKLKFGDNLELHYDGSDSYVSDVGPGGLIISGNNIDFKNQAKNENFLLIGGSNNNVRLYSNNSKILTTYDSGIEVTGIVTATSFSGDGSNLTGVGDITSSLFS